MPNAIRKEKKMAVKITVRQSQTANATVDIPESTKKDVEDAFKQLKANPGSELHLAFGDEAERIKWTKEARAYCSTREKGALRLRQLPSQSLPPNEVRIQITDDLEANGARNGRRQQA